MKQSLYNDQQFRTMFLGIAVGLAKSPRADWEVYISTDIPRLIKEAREQSRTPELDEGFIMGAVAALNARRAIDASEGV